MRLACLAALLLCSTQVRGDPSVAVNVGVIEVRALPGGGHVGTYLNAALSLAFPAGRWTVIPGLGYEYDFAHDRGGFVPTLTFDYAVVPDRFGLDVGAVLIHDMDHFNFSTSQFYLGGGLGFSVFLGRFTVSPFCNLFRGLDTHDWSLVPGINLAWGL
jgi:hypothetical protein